MRLSLAIVLPALLVWPLTASAKEEHHPAPHRQHAQARHVVAAPALASLSNSRFTAAPVPNPDITAPPEPENPRTHLAPAIFKLSNEYSGDGYVYGSSPQGMDDRKAALIPGLKLTTPLP